MVLGIFSDNQGSINKKNNLKAKIYINKQLFKSGIFVIGETKSSNLKHSSHTIKFASSVFNLKDVVGEGKLNDLAILGDDNYWSMSKARNLMQYPTSYIYCPLVSTNRVWNYGLTGLNDISLLANKIKIRELRPAVSFRTIFNKIVQQYDLDIEFPFKESPQFKDLFLWLNGETESIDRQLDFINGFGAISNPSSVPVAHFPVINTTTNLITVTRTSNNYDILDLTTTVTLENLATSDDISATVDIIDMRPGREGTVLGSRTVEKASGSSFNITCRIKSTNIAFTTVAPLIYKVVLRTNFPVQTSTVSHKYLVRPLGFINSYSYTSTGNTIGGESIDLNKSFPDMKIIDFLTGIIKMFNISVKSDKMIPNKSYWTPKNLVVRNTYDYTDAIDADKLTTKDPTRYKTYDFKHKESSFYSTEAFKIANVSNPNSKAYGQLIYTDIEEATTSSYTVESTFSITPSRNLEGSNMEFFYGFEYDKNVSLEYKPNTKDTLIFYKTGLETIIKDDGTQGTIYLDNGSGGSYSVTQYTKSSIADNSDELLYTNSLGYKDEVNENPFFIYNNNLFSNFYGRDLERLYNRNTKVFNYDAVLNANQLQQINTEDDMVIRNQKYSVEEVDVDLNSGKARFTLMNYPPVTLSVVNYPPLPPTIFTATLL